MDKARLSRFPHLSWQTFEVNATPDAGPLCWKLNGKAHALNVAFCRPTPVRLISRGCETRFDHRTGAFHFRPADNDPYTVVAHPVGPVRCFKVFMPPQHLTDLAAADHMDNPVEFHRLLLFDDSVLQACMSRLAAQTAEENSAGDVMKDEAARRIVLRLVEMSGGGTPGWTRDDSVFADRTLRYLVEYIDAHLRMAPTLSDIALLVGLSPSHFAKKFRHSTGLSLQRFVNRRRIMRSLELLKQPSKSLTSVALELGFSSQSHFTRLFSDLTCMTPAKYQKQFRRTVG